MSEKSRLISLAGDLQRIVDQLLECCKEEDNEEKEESPSKPSKASMIAIMLKKKLGK